ncbi:hypothetical protein K402DRAFT_343069 [Aulographum hederae CBS 113979]|uniref:HAT C-terminal dimerisation domain-containing protein n=1 Tax=Aulographum hederae CBS 113979 TaxID=1176131 RepID=A0A6G1GJM2_9PEZI|nr:hypothetical protein K402DRAFT_343069 [Aulographum hederae CBS 113979]
MLRQREKISEAAEEKVRGSFDREHFLELQALFIVRRRLPFHIVTWPEYRALLISVNPIIKDQLISSDNTVRQHIRASYTHHREALREKLKHAKSMVHFSSDLWTSPK